MKNTKVTITSALLAIAAFSSMADAKCAFTSPLGDSSFAAGDTMPINWIDDGSEPKCSDMTLGIELRVGSQNEQKVAATVTSSVLGSAGSASFVIPQELQQTDSTYFLEMHKKDAPEEFQNFSGRFTITGVKAASGSSGSSSGKDSDSGDNNGDSSSNDSNSSSDNNNDNSDSSDSSNSKDTGDKKDDSDNADTNDKGKPSKDPKDSDDKPADDNSSSDQNNSNVGGTSDSEKPTDDTPQQANSASSSWTASFTSLAIVAVGAILSNVF